MKKIYFIILSTLLMITMSFSCKKDNSNSHSVSYKIIETIPGSSPYMVRYTMADGTFRSEGPITSETWISENMGGYKNGAIVSLYLDSPGGTYDMYIYVNGSISSQASADGGFGEQLLEAQVP